MLATCQQQLVISPQLRTDPLPPEQEPNAMQCCQWGPEVMLVAPCRWSENAASWTAWQCDVTARSAAGSELLLDLQLVVMRH
jgi:hypothetical protein